MMKQSNRTLDVTTLVAYLSNQLSDDERAEVTAVLVRDPESRELLAMAAKAMSVEKDRHRGQLVVDSADRKAERKGSPRTTAKQGALKSRRG
jgi:anti-sigma factor RsiW